MSTLSPSTATTPPDSPRITMLGIAEHFSPAWFASVMGTAVIPLAASFLPWPDVSQWIARVFLVLAIGMYLAALGPWLARFLLFPQAIRNCFNHPIASNFFPTMPIALIVIALVFLKFPTLFFSADVAQRIALSLWLAGSIGIYLMGFVILMHVFRHTQINMSHANFGWFIPPVSKLLIPVGGLELAGLFPALHELTVGLSLASMGIGFFLFLFVGATVYHRYVYHELPMSRFAPTFFVGIAPTAIISVGLFKLLHLLQHEHVLGIDPAAVEGVIRLAIVMCWGLAAWWFIMALILTAFYIRTMTLPYALSWWAFTFPTGALGVSTGVTWKITGYQSIWWFYLAVVGLLLIIWLIVALRTVRGMLSGKVFQPAH
jgi:C4-dicarboxylate transporter/malic acid transport protein